ncbi:hypothetical protein EVAR_97548_1 [Eumeta japonica]|uniref:Uncharacterized protein n=1 Tax=Eumeta variegata TaxID=151549 RepID=A0A4C1SFN1_EUMVA|nr:hypothetical protein EVAR_97548_1 [Eumeta japonica]
MNIDTYKDGRKKRINVIPTKTSSARNHHFVLATNPSILARSTKAVVLQFTFTATTNDSKTGDQHMAQMVIAQLEKEASVSFIAV